jgi:hypothetical protein
MDENPYRSPAEKGAVPAQPSAVVLWNCVRAFMTLITAAFGLLFGWVAMEIAKELYFYPGLRGRPDGSLMLIGSLAGFASLACFASAICWVLRRDKFGAILFAIGFLCPVVAVCSLYVAIA